ncbi:MAG: M20/M25/M40 family metallo-hydrolase [Anaerolineae bacterium]|nr:M20/M25/M40 family metallo-hydrolase [Anaerolineae bacterium]
MKLVKTLPLFLILVCLLACSFPAAGPARTPAVFTPQRTATAVYFNGAQRARQHLQALSQQIGARVAGTDGAKKAAAYISAQFEQMGYKTERQVFDFINEDGRSAPAENIIACKTGGSPREIIVGAHYDSVDAGQGADDNASGVAVLLAAAEAVKDLQTPYSLCFITFDAEETGLKGSENYVDRMDVNAVNNTLVMINLDSLAVGNQCNLYGTPGALHDWVLAQAQPAGLTLHDETRFDPKDPANDFSDHAAFRRAGIDFLYFEASDWSLGEQDGYTQVDEQFGEAGKIWHTPYDRLDYIDATFPGRLDDHLHLYTTLLIDILTNYR